MSTHKKESITILMDGEEICLFETYFERDVEANVNNQENFKDESRVFIGNIPLWANRKKIFERLQRFGDIESLYGKHEKGLKQLRPHGFISFYKPESAKRAKDAGKIKFGNTFLTLKSAYPQKNKT